MSTILLRITSIIIIVIPSLVLIGWEINNEILKRVTPDLVAMNPVSAIFLIIFGIFLFWQTYSQAKLTQILRTIFFVAIVIISLIAVLRYFSNIDLQIDRLLFSSKLAENRMALSTAFCFLLLGINFLLIDIRRRGIRFALQAAVILTVLIAGQGIITNIFNFAGFFQYRIFVPIALSVSTCFILLSISLLAIRKDFEINIFIRNLFIKSSINQKVNASLILSLSLLLLVGIVTYITTRQLIESSGSVATKIQKIKLRTQLVDDLVNAESAQRGYIITGQGDYLVPYANGISDYPPTFENLLKLADNPEEADRLHRLNGLAQQKIEDLANTLNIRRTQNFDAAQKVIVANTGKDLMDQIRDINQEMDEFDQKDLTALSENDTLATGRSINTIILGSLTGLLIVIIEIIFINRNLKKARN